MNHNPPNTKSPQKQKMFFTQCAKTPPQNGILQEKKLAKMNNFPLAQFYIKTTNAKIGILQIVRICTTFHCWTLSVSLYCGCYLTGNLTLRKLLPCLFVMLLHRPQPVHQLVFGVSEGERTPHPYREGGHPSLRVLEPVLEPSPHKFDFLVFFGHVSGIEWWTGFTQSMHHSVSFSWEVPNLETTGDCRCNLIVLPPVLCPTLPFAWF